MRGNTTDCNGTCEVCECNKQQVCHTELAKYRLQSRLILERSSSKLNTNN